MTAVIKTLNGEGHFEDLESPIFQPNLTQSILELRGLKFFIKKVLRVFNSQKGDNDYFLSTLWYNHSFSQVSDVAHGPLVYENVEIDHFPICLTLRG